MPYYNIDPHPKHSLIFTRCFICERVVKYIDINENSIEEDKWRHNHTISDHLKSAFWEQVHHISTCCVQPLGCPVHRGHGLTAESPKKGHRNTETQNLDDLLFKEILRELWGEKCHMDLSNARRNGGREDRAGLLPVVPSKRTRGKEIPFKHWKKHFYC